MFKNIIKILEPLNSTGFQDITPSQSQDLLDALSQTPPNLQSIYDKISKHPPIRIHFQNTTGVVVAPPSQDTILIRTTSNLIMGIYICKTNTQSIYTLFYGKNSKIPEELHDCPIYITDSQITIDLKPQFIPHLYPIFLILDHINNNLPQGE